MGFSVALSVAYGELGDTSELEMWFASRWRHGVSVTVLLSGPCREEFGDVGGESLGDMFRSEREDKEAGMGTRISKGRE